MRDSEVLDLGVPHHIVNVDLRWYQWFRFFDFFGFLRLLGLRWWSFSLALSWLWGRFSWWVVIDGDHVMSDTLTLENLLSHDFIEL